MSSLSNMVKAYAQGAQTSFGAPLAALKGSQIALNTIVAGSTTSTAGLVLMTDKTFNIEFSSLVAIVQAGITTTSLVVTPQWQVSLDGTNWVNFLGMNCAANVAFPTGTGSLVTTTSLIATPGTNYSFPFMRFSVLSAGATGGAGDNLTVAYQWRRRFVSSTG